MHTSQTTVRFEKPERFLKNHVSTLVTPRNFSFYNSCF